jgi:hypothetical protein
MTAGRTMPAMSRQRAAFVAATLAILGVVSLAGGVLTAHPSPVVRPAPTPGAVLASPMRTCPPRPALWLPPGWPSPRPGEPQPTAFDAFLALEWAKQNQPCR